MAQDGWKSRKLWTTFLAMALITWGFIMCGHPKDIFGEFVMAILTASGLYKAASVYEKKQAPVPPPAA